MDFQLRGPGDLLGTRQHGLPGFRLADLKRDTEIISEARVDARNKLIAADPGLAHPSTPNSAAKSSRSTAKRSTWETWDKLESRL